MLCNRTILASAFFPPFCFKNYVGQAIKMYIFIQMHKIQKIIITI